MIHHYSIEIIPQCTNHSFPNLPNREEKKPCWTDEEKRLEIGACCVGLGEAFERPRFRRPTNHGSFLLLLVTLARALPPASTRPFFACSSRLHTRHDQYLTWPSTHGRRCTRTTTAQVCAFTCQWKISPRKKTNGPTFLPLHFSSSSFFNYFKGGLKFRKY